MRNAIKKAVSALLIAVMMFGIAPLSGFVGLELPEINFFSSKAEAATASGTCGDNLTWTFDESTGELVISGTGDMHDWSYRSSAPWYSYRSSIKTVTIGNGVTSIGEEAFYFCSNIASVTIPCSVTSIGDDAFLNCDSLTEVSYPGTLEQWNEISVGSNNSNLPKNVIYECNSSEPYHGGVCGENLFWKLYTNGELVISGTGAMTDSITSMSRPWYTYISSIKSVVIHNGVTSIGYGAFEYCDNLANVTIGNSVTSIGDMAFFFCTSLKSITIPDSITSIGMGAFEGCLSFTSITIPDSVTSIGMGAFGACPNVEDVKIGKGVTRIANYLFAQCKKLKNITIPKSVESVGFNAFLNCINIENVNYEGSKADWRRLEIEDGNEHLTSAKINYGFSDSASTNKPDNTPDYDSAVTDTFLVSNPTESKISYGDSIVLHLDPSKIPEGGYVEWYPSNGNFSYSVSADGTTCTITPSKSGDTIFTALVYDAEGNVVSADTQEMTSKAGFFDKIIAFFKKLFGLTKTIPQAIK